MINCSLYCVTCKTTGRMYVGVTEKSFDHRWGRHVADTRRGSDLKFHRAVRKYGPDDFDGVVLHVYLSREDAYAAEIAMIRELDLISGGYNTSPGGVNPTAGTKRGPLSPEWRAKLSASKKGVPKPPFTDAHRAALSAAMTGRVQSQETRDRISSALKGRVFTPDWLAKMSVGRKGRKMSEEFCDKLRMRNLGKTLSVETKRKMSETRRGRVVPESTRILMRMARQRMHMDRLDFTAPEMAA